MRFESVPWTGSSWLPRIRQHIRLGNACFAAEIYFSLPTARVGVQDELRAFLGAADFLCRVRIHPEIRALDLTNGNTS